MTTLPTVLISGASEELTSRIEQLIRSQPELSLVNRFSPEQAEQKGFQSKLVWLELESDPQANLKLLERLIHLYPNTFFVVSKEDLEPELVKKTMQIGALDFLDHKGWAAQIRSVIRRVMTKEFGAQGAQKSAIPRQPSKLGPMTATKVPPSSIGFRRVEPNRPSSSATTGGATPSALSKPAPQPLPGSNQARPVPSTLSPQAPSAPVKPAAPPAVPAPKAAVQPAPSSTPFPAPTSTPTSAPAANPTPAPAEKPAAAPKPALESASTSTPQAPTPVPQPAEPAQTPIAPKPAPKLTPAPLKEEPADAPSASTEKARAEVDEPAPQPRLFPDDSMVLSVSDLHQSPSLASKSLPAMFEPTKPFAFGKHEESVKEISEPNDLEPAQEESESREDLKASREFAAFKPKDASGGYSDMAGYVSESSDEKPVDIYADVRKPRTHIPPPRQRIGGETAPLKNLKSQGSLEQASGLPAKDSEDVLEFWCSQPSSEQNVNTLREANEDKQLPVEYETKAGSQSGEPEPQSSDYDFQSAESNDDDPGKPIRSAPARSSPPLIEEYDTSTNEDASMSMQEDEDKLSSDDDIAGSASPGPQKKGRWDELDSIISKQPKSADSEAKPQSGGSKWGDLDSIGVKPAQMGPVESTQKWGGKELDSMAPETFQKPNDQAAASKSDTIGKSKWGDLDAIPTPGKADSGAKSSKWDDLDAIPTPKSDLGAKSSRWDDLDAIPTPGSGKTDTAGATGKSKWGDLNSIPTPGADKKDMGGARFSKWEGLEAIPTPNSLRDDTAGATTEKGGKWGDLDAIPTLGAAEDAPSGGSKFGAGEGRSNLMGGPSQSSSVFKNRFGKKTTGVDIPVNLDESPQPSSSGAAAPAGGKWGDLDAIPTAGDVGHEPAGGKWGDLDAIATPGDAVHEADDGKWGNLDAITSPSKKHDRDTEQAKENQPMGGSLPSPQAPSQSAVKWKHGMGSDLNPGVKEVGAMRDKLVKKSHSAGAAFGWNNISLVLAVAILGLAFFFSWSFFSYQSQSTSQGTTK